MFGSSRDSLAVCQEGLDARRQDAGFALLSGELFAVAGVLDREGQLCTDASPRWRSSDIGSMRNVSPAETRNVSPTDRQMANVIRRWAGFTRRSSQEASRGREPWRECSRGSAHSVAPVLRQHPTSARDTELRPGAIPLR